MTWGELLISPRIVLDFTIVSYYYDFTDLDLGPGGEYYQKNWVGVCGPLPKPLPYL